MRTGCSRNALARPWSYTWYKNWNTVQRDSLRFWIVAYSRMGVSICGEVGVGGGVLALEIPVCPSVVDFFSLAAEDEADEP